MKILGVIAVCMFMAGCATLTTEGTQVRLVSQHYVESNNCKFKGTVSNKIDYFGDDWVVDLRNKVAAIGGNVLVTQSEKSYIVSKTASGEGYFCSG